MARRIALPPRGAASSPRWLCGARAGSRRRLRRRRPERRRCARCSRRRDGLRSAGDERPLLGSHPARDLRHALRLGLFRAAVPRMPNAAAAMPEITDGGRTWTIRVRPGIYFADDPAFKGKKRELTAADYVYSWKRLIDPKMRAPFAWYIQGKIVGADAVVEAGAKSGKFDYDAAIEGLRAIDRYTIRMQLKEPDYIMLGYLTTSPMAAVAREVVEAYGDASGWIQANPVGTGPYRAEVVAARSADRARGEPELSRRDVSRQPAARAGRPVRRAARQEAADRRPHRDQHHRGIEPAAPRLQQRRARLRQRAVRPRRQRARQRHAAAGVHRTQRPPCARHAAGAAVRVLQRRGSRRRRHDEGEDRAAPRDRAGIRPRRADPRRLPGAGAAGDAADSAEPAGPRPVARRRASNTTPRRRRRCSTSSATSTATATATARCRTGSR